VRYVLGMFETFILKEMFINNGSANLESILSMYKNQRYIPVDDWKIFNGEPTWVLEIKRSHHHLKDLGLIYGLEHGIWILTERGMELGAKLYSSNNEIVTSALKENIVLEDQPPLIYSIEEEPPQTITSVVTRKIRDTKLSRFLKEKYNNTCQICGLRIRLGNGHTYSEAHHLKPLGNPHNGPDIESNILVLCPNHHAEFDGRAIALNPQLKIIEHIDMNSKYINKPLFLLKHSLGFDFLDYHYQLFKKNEPYK
jgi:hypothetical protein